MALKKLATHISATIMENYDIAKAFQSEIGSLETFARVDNPHLIKSICTFQHGDDGYYIMFPWATCNLRELFWGEDCAPDSVRTVHVADEKRVRWILEQLSGLSKAIFSLHNLNKSDFNSLAPNGTEEPNCRHGDLKPENILVMGSGSGRLVIADVGLTKVHNLPTRYRKDSTRSITGTAKYEPPDILRNNPRSRAYDIWSFGCICLESIIWVLYGPSGLPAFHTRMSAQSKFWFSPHEDEARKAMSQQEASLGASGSKLPEDVKLIVDKALKECNITKNIRLLLEEMRDKDPRCSDKSPLGDLLNLTERRLLMVEINLLSATRSRASRYRANAKEMFDGIDEIRRKALDDAEYLHRSLGSFPMPKPPLETESQKPTGLGSSLGADLQLPTRPISEHRTPFEGSFNSPDESAFHFRVEGQEEKVRKLRGLKQS